MQHLILLREYIGERSVIIWLHTLPLVIKLPELAGDGQRFQKCIEFSFEPVALLVVSRAKAIGNRCQRLGKEGDVIVVCIDHIDLRSICSDRIDLPALQGDEHVREVVEIRDLALREKSRRQFRELPAGQTRNAHPRIVQRRETLPAHVVGIILLGDQQRGIRAVESIVACHIHHRCQVRIAREKLPHHLIADQNRVSRVVPDECSERIRIVHSANIRITDRLRCDRRQAGICQNTNDLSGKVFFTFPWSLQ